MAKAPRTVLATYFDAWKAKDFDAYQSLLADDVTFDGPLGQAVGAKQCRLGLEALSEIVTDVVVEHVFVDGPDVLTWFQLHTSVAPPCPTANWSHVEDGKITRIRATFDPRLLVTG
ncbi:MAG: hypothetical protein QOG43_1634 [Actinomycetota bacterium]|jgi:ketosteroid isomerase-like protein|nr:hypothetical protein [Actinomycetota bacterium]